MIIDIKEKQIQTPKGWYGFAIKTISSIRDLTVVTGAIFYNPAIPSGLKLRKVSI